MSMHTKKRICSTYLSDLLVVSFPKAMYKSAWPFLTVT